MVALMWSWRREGIVEAHGSMITGVMLGEWGFRKVGETVTVEFILPSHWLSQHGWVTSVCWALISMDESDPFPGWRHIEVFPTSSFSLPVGKEGREYEGENGRGINSISLLSTFYPSGCKTLNYRSGSYASIITTQNWYLINCLLSGIGLNLCISCRISYSQEFTEYHRRVPRAGWRRCAFRVYMLINLFLTWEKMRPLKVFSLEIFMSTVLQVRSLQQKTPTVGKKKT